MLVPSENDVESYYVTCRLALDDVCQGHSGF